MSWNFVEPEGQDVGCGDSCIMQNKKEQNMEVVVRFALDIVWSRVSY